MPIVHPRETWFITSTGSVANTSDGKLNLYMSPVPLLSPGQSVDLLVYVTPEIVNASATYRNLFNEGAFTTEGYLHTHDDKSSITHTHTGLNILTGGPFSSANSLHTHDGFTTVSEVNNLIIDSLNGEIDFSFYVRKDGSINQLSDIVSDGDAIENAVSKVHDQNHTLLEHLDDVPVTTANLIKLMDGSNADCCHTHSFQVVITEHNELDDLQGGGTNEYYHLIEEKYSLVNRLDEDSSGLTFDGVSLLDTLWKRSGTTLTPINSGDDVLLNGDLTAANITGTILTSYQPNISHNTLADLQGGDTNEFYHLIEEKYSLVNRLDEDSSGLTFDGVTLEGTHDDRYLPLKTATDSYHYSGFPNRTDTVLSWDDTTTTLTLTVATTARVWISGVEYNISTLTKQFTAVQAEATGLYWFWITAPLGVPQLNYSITSPDIGSGGANAGFDQCLVANVYWNTVTNKGLYFDERHWFGRDCWMHEYLHETVGARFAYGMAGTFGNSTFEIGIGEFYDEDIEHHNIAETVATILYHDGSNNWKWDTAVTTPYKLSGANLVYNNGTTLTAAAANRFVNYFFFMTPDPVDPVHIIIGTAQYTTLASAIAAPVPSLGALPGAENKLIYKVTYINAGPPEVRNTIDYRTSSTLPTSGYVATDHSSLSNLTSDDHLQYAHINGRLGGQTIRGGTGTGESLILLNNDVDALGITISTLVDLGALYLTTTGRITATRYNLPGTANYIDVSGEDIQINSVSGGIRLIHDDDNDLVWDQDLWIEGGPSNLGKPTALWQNLYLSGLASIGGVTTIKGTPTGITYEKASLIINPSGATANHLLQSWSVGNSLKASIDAEGDFTTTGDITGSNLNVAGWDAHLINNNQAHTDYLKNNANDSTSGSLTAASFKTADLTIGADTISSSDYFEMNIDDEAVFTAADDITFNSTDGNIRFTTDGRNMEFNPAGGNIQITNGAVTIEDNKLISFGGGEDLKISSDGTNGIIDVETDLRLGSATATYVNIETDGDMFFVGGSSGLPYGSCYGAHIGWAQASAAQNTWYNISDADMADGVLNLVTHDGSGKLTVIKAGRYLINYSISLDCSENDTHLETGIEITNSGSANAAGICCFDTYERLQSVSGTAVISLAANATIEVAIRTTDAGTPDISVQDINLTVVQVGG